MLSDEVRLRHMLDAANEAMSFAAGHEREVLDRDRKLALALVRLIEIIGEAAAGVGTATREQAPQIPWPSIVGMRNRLIHSYFDIDLDRVWDTVADDLPPLIAALEPLIQAESGSS